MMNHFRKIKNTCVVLAVISSIIAIFMIPNLDSISPHMIFFDNIAFASIFQWMMLPIYFFLIPVIFIILAILMQRISNEIRNESIQVYQQIVDLEKEVDKVKKKIGM